ncbi:MAG: hypothetical protein JO222_01415 [Frankiales bacterium]|nr:hypothetical protein [Frankiales bacterium]
MTPEEARQRGSLGAHVRWAQTADRSAATAAARAAALERFEREVDPDGLLPPEERALRAKHAKAAHMRRMSMAAAKARRERRSA